MAVDGAFPALAIRSSASVELWGSSELKSPYEPKPEFAREETKNCRSIIFSSDGQYLAYTNGTEVKIISTSNWEEKCRVPRPKASYLQFSPRGSYLVTWELYITSKDKPEGASNMFVYKIETGEEVFSTIQKRQTDWEPCWSGDESLFALMIGGEAFFYELNNEGFKKSARKMGGGHGGVLSLGPGNSPPFLAFYTRGVKGAPSMCKIYKYPALLQNQTVACKSFFQADRVEMLWNKRGTGLLLLTSTEVDKTGASYYGNQALHFISTKGDSCAVALAKDGPIHSVQWSPKANEFVVVYGYMPSKATLFNLKCDVSFDFGEGPRNCAYFNDFGNMLILAGFGNLRGDVEVWDVIKKTQIATMQAADSTLLEWSPTGETFLTATTAPRLRTGNGFKVWHYSGALLHETLWPEGQELLGVGWQKFPEGVFKEKAISNVKIDGIKSSQPEASKQVYEPPNIRLLKEGKDPGELVPQPKSVIPGLPPGYTNKNASSNSSRQRKQKNRRDSKQSNATADPSNESLASTINNDRPVSKSRNMGNRQRYNSFAKSDEKDAGDVNNHNERTGLQPRNKKNNRGPAKLSTGDPEKEKKIRHLYKKLSDISKLKDKQGKGEHLEANQLSKIAGEFTLREELKALKISS